MIEYGLNHVPYRQQPRWKLPRIKNKQFILILYSFTPSDMNFQAILMPKVILAKILSQKITHLENSYF